MPIGGACTTDRQCGRCTRCDQVCQVEPINDLVLGHRDLCYLGATGSRWCAGENRSGELGLGDATDHSPPRRIPGEDGWTKLALAYGTSFGIRGGDLWSWGSSTLFPKDRGPATNIAEILTENAGSCIRHVDGTFDCDPTNTPWNLFALGDNDFCAIKLDGTLWCSGTDAMGDLGQGVLASGTKLMPTQVGVDTDWIAVSAGQQMTCAVKSVGRLYCWGDPMLTGTNKVDTMGVPTQVGTDTDWIGVRADYRKTCATKSDGSVWCWGNDTQGGYIVPDHADVPVPIRVGVFDRFVIGGHGACALSVGRWQCYGWNASGQLGQGNTDAITGFVDLCP